MAALRFAGVVPVGVVDDVRHGSAWTAMVGLDRGSSGSVQEILGPDGLVLVRPPDPNDIVDQRIMGVFEQA
jgi:hypothetical protein